MATSSPKSCLKSVVVWAIFLVQDSSGYYCQGTQSTCCIAWGCHPWQVLAYKGVSLPDKANHSSSRGCYQVLCRHALVLAPNESTRYCKAARKLTIFSRSKWAAAVCEWVSHSSCSKHTGEARGWHPSRLARFTRAIAYNMSSRLGDAAPDLSPRVCVQAAPTGPEIFQCWILFSEATWRRAGPLLWCWTNLFHAMLTLSYLKLKTKTLTRFA